MHNQTIQTNFDNFCVNFVKFVLIWSIFVNLFIPWLIEKRPKRIRKVTKKDVKQTNKTKNLNVVGYCKAIAATLH